MFLINNSHSKNKVQARPGWLCAWFSRPRGGKRRCPGGFRKLGCETLERRELLSASINPNGVSSWKTIDLTMNGTASGTSSQFGPWTATGSGSVSMNTWTDEADGNFSASGTGTISPSGYGTLTGTVISGDVKPDATNSNTLDLNGTVNITGSVVPGWSGSGTAYLDTTDFSITAGGSAMGWSVKLTPVIPPTPFSTFDVTLTTPTWDSSAHTQIDFRFTVAGTTGYPTVAGQGPLSLAQVTAYWASGTTTNSIIGSEIGAVPVYWNQASYSGSIGGISPSTIPAGANYVLIEVGNSANLVAFPLAPVVTPVVTGISPESGSVAGATTVTITGTGFTDATAVDFGPTAATLVATNSAGTQITATSPPGTATVDVTVVTPSGTSAVSALDRFTYNAAPIADGNFEMPALADGAYQIDQVGSPWQFSGMAGVSGNQSAFTAGNPNAPDGTQVALIKDGGSISQSVQFTAGSYQLSFQAAQRGNYQSQPQQIKVLVDGSLVSTITPSGIAYSGYATPIFTVTAGTLSIELLGLAQSTADSTAFIDTVSIGQSPSPWPTTVSRRPRRSPAPSSWRHHRLALDVLGHAGVASNQSAFTAGNPDAPDGTQVAVLKNNAVLFSRFSSAARARTTSHLRRPAGYFAEPAQQIEVLLDGSAVCTITPSGTSYVMYTTSNFTVAPGTHAITFLGLAPSTADSTAFIDTVSIGQPSVAVANPSFEAPPLPTGTFQLGAITGSSWTFSGSTGFAGNQSAFTAGNPNAPDGTQVAVLKNNGSMSQAVSFDAGSYVISFNAAQRAKYQSQAAADRGPHRRHGPQHDLAVRHELCPLHDY